jgi:predicted permease
MLNTFIQLFPIIVPTILIVFLGFIWNKLGNLVDQSEITNIITWVGAPCLIFNTLIKLESSIFIIQDIILAAILMILIMFACSYIVLKLFKYPIRPLINPMVFSNSGNLGMTISLFAFGALGLELAVIYFMITSMLHFTIGLSIWSGKWSFKFLIKTPILYAVLAGLLINFNSIELPKTITNTTSILSGITIPLLLFTMGISINKISYKIEPKIIMLIIIRIIIATSLAYTLTIILDIKGIARDVILLQGVLPAPIFAYLFASQFNVNPEKVANYLMTSTFISLFTITIFLTLVL